MAFRSAGATEEMIAAARLIYGSLPNEPPGRPRMYKTAKEADHAFYMRHRDRFREKRAISPKNGHHPLPSEYVEAVGRTLIGTEMQPPARVLSLKEVLVNAAGGNVDSDADVEPIRRLLDQYCDLEADILPTVARMVPELPRPLKNWGAQWLVQAILEARDLRLQAVVSGLCLDRALSLDEPAREASSNGTRRGSALVEEGTSARARSATEPHRRGAREYFSQVFSRCFRRSRLRAVALRPILVPTGA